MKRILITGATGNVGTEVIKALLQAKENSAIYAGVRHAPKAGAFPEHVKPVHFDFENPDTQEAALQHTDVLFLLRPPQLAAVKKDFDPLIARAKKAGVQHIVFLSVQGAGSNSFIPHHKIENSVAASGIPYTFLRPAYFMQNFTTTLRNDLVRHRRIFLPAGSAPFTLVDVGDIGAVAAVVLAHPENFLNCAYDLTAEAQYTFPQMATILSEVLQTAIRYESPNLLRFYLAKRKEGLAPGFIAVMMLLHFLPRFQKAPAVSQSIRHITGNVPTDFRQFAERHKAQLLG